MVEFCTAQQIDREVSPETTMTSIIENVTPDYTKNSKKKLEKKFFPFISFFRFLSLGFSHLLYGFFVSFSFLY